MALGKMVMVMLVMRYIFKEVTVGLIFSTVIVARCMYKQG